MQFDHEDELLNLRFTQFWESSDIYQLFCSWIHLSNPTRISQRLFCARWLPGHFKSGISAEGPLGGLSTPHFYFCSRAFPNTQLLAISGESRQRKREKLFFSPYWQLWRKTEKNMTPYDEVLGSSEYVNYSVLYHEWINACGTEYSSIAETVKISNNYKANNSNILQIKERKRITKSKFMATKFFKKLINSGTLSSFYSSKMFLSVINIVSNSIK